MPKLRNIVIFAVIAIVVIGGGYYYFTSSSDNTASLVVQPSNTSGAVPVAGSPLSEQATVTQNFLTLLLNVRNIRLDDQIFSDPAFLSLKDSSIDLVQDGTEGRPNPFAPFGTDSSAQPATTPATTTPANTPTGTTTPPSTTSTPPANGAH